MKKRKGAAAVSVIGGADGPTSIFIAGKNKKADPITRIKRYRYRKKRAKTEKSIKADPHTLEEVIQYLKDAYGAVEVSEQSFQYKEQRAGVKELLIERYQPELLGDMAVIGSPQKHDEESLRAFWKQVEERSKRAQEIPDEQFPLEYHIYRIQYSEQSQIQVEIEKNWNIFSCSYSGKKQEMKKLRNISRDAYLYYGVSETDIEERSERYASLVTVLSL